MPTYYHDRGDNASKPIRQCEGCSDLETCEISQHQCEEDWEAEKADCERDEQMMKGASR